MPKRDNILACAAMLGTLGLVIGVLGCSTSSSLFAMFEGEVLDVSVDASSSQTGGVRLEQTPSRASSLFLAQSSPRSQMLPITAQAMLNNTLINLEVATTLRQQSVGLMYRTSLDDNRGMLFPFSPARPVTFWMRNVEISLDMVFMDGEEVIAIASQVPPCRTVTCPTYGPVGIPVDFVLELRGGRAEELGLEVGDRIPITFFKG